MLSEARQKREKNKRDQQFSILRPQNFWSGGRAPTIPPPDPHLNAA